VEKAAKDNPSENERKLLEEVEGMRRDWREKERREDVATAVAKARNEWLKEGRTESERERERAYALGPSAGYSSDGHRNGCPAAADLTMSFLTGVNLGINSSKLGSRPRSRSRSRSRSRDRNRNRDRLQYDRFERRFEMGVNCCAAIGGEGRRRNGGVGFASGDFGKTLNRIEARQEEADFDRLLERARTSKFGRRH
jgi:hypothetical protein